MRSLPELIQDPVIVEFQRVVRGLNPRMREAFLLEFFSPELKQPQGWLETDSKAYQERLRNRLCHIKDE